MFFIFDCNGDIVGNKKGYATHKGAQMQCEKKGKIKTTIWTTYALKPQNNKNETALVYSIKWVEPVDPVQFMREHFQIIHVH